MLGSGPRACRSNGAFALLKNSGAGYPPQFYPASRPAPASLAYTRRSITASSQNKGKVPYFHKKLSKKDQPPSSTLVDSFALEPKLTQPVLPTSNSQPAPKLRSSKESNSSSKPDTTSKRQVLKTINPSSHLMNEIRVLGLGRNAEHWHFDKASRTNKTFRPWEKPKRETPQLPPPSKQVWFEQRSRKIVEKEEVRFPGMRFIAGAATTPSVPTELQLVRMTRPYLFEDLESIDQLVLEATGKVDRSLATEAGAIRPEPTITPNDEGPESSPKPAEKGISIQPRLESIDPVEIQKLLERKRDKEVSIKGSTMGEIAVVGRSNVGKSTMLNTLTDSPNTARVSDKPGLTRQLNFYRCGEKFILVDMPGYGFAFAKEEDQTAWTSLIERYLCERKSLRRIYVLIDARHGLKVADKTFLDMLESKSKKFQVVLTKCDLIPPPDLARCYTMVQEELKKSYKYALTGRLLMVSSYTGAGMNNLRKDMLFACGQDILIRDRERPKSTLRTL
ncbi:hypothetical protein BGW38_000408 [Lunasporangiospora selenospora]|uniref:EngB-type G domain-containing protein n=1 Tax=Lunasporangiospora selenospora TaxID=979761 RepID=A0A9P6FVK4_9FUNG|nr:hypothetical protein BGW38_000408 [Lunasporangiospora selenospora]